MLKPKLVIESGIWRGLGTWIVRQAAPEAQIILLDPVQQNPMAYIDNHTDTRYFTNEKFRDFATVHTWKDIQIDGDNTLAFIDDHNVPFKRIPEARKAGIKHMIFEDNYWVGKKVDCFSLKQGCGCLMQEPECSSFKYRDEYGKIMRDLTESDMKLVSETFDELKIYAEFPSIWHVFNPNGQVMKRSRNYLYEDGDGKSILRSNGLEWLPTEDQYQYNSGYSYFNIAYVKL